MKKILFLLLLLCLGCKSKEPENIVVIEKDPLRFLALGDSYTIGEDVEISQRWPMQLTAKLMQAGFNIEEPRIVAKTGWTTQELLQGMEMQLINEKFDLVSVLIGVNNQYRGQSLASYEVDLRKIFDEAVKHSEKGAAGVFAISIPDYGVTPFGEENEQQIKVELEGFNQVFKNVASEYNIEFFNITPISRRAKKDPSLIASDNLHPSGKMYTLWVDHILVEIIKKLK